jgi:hypothetical protein
MSATFSQIVGPAGRAGRLPAEVAALQAEGVLVEAPREVRAGAWRLRLRGGAAAVVSLGGEGPEVAARLAARGEPALLEAFGAVAARSLAGASLEVEAGGLVVAASLREVEELADWLRVLVALQEGLQALEDPALGSHYVRLYLARKSAEEGGETLCPES